MQQREGAEKRRHLHTDGNGASLPPAESRKCANCGDFIPDGMGFQVEGQSLCAGCLPWPELGRGDLKP